VFCVGVWSGFWSALWYCQWQGVLRVAGRHALATDSTTVHSKNRSTHRRKTHLFNQVLFIVLITKILMTFYQHNRCILRCDEILLWNCGSAFDKCLCDCLRMNAVGSKHVGTFFRTVCVNKVRWLVCGNLYLRQCTPRSVHVGFVVDKVTLGQVFPRVVWFSPVSFIPPVLRY
jgi:hypothetical protein